jgi:hypothetical protein
MLLINSHFSFLCITYLKVNVSSLLAKGWGKARQKRGGRVNNEHTAEGQGLRRAEVAADKY